MAYGVISFKDSTAAEDFVKEQGVGTVLTAGDLASHEWKQNTDNMNMDMHGEEGHMDDHMSEDQDGMHNDQETGM
jgi:copper chaperone NosL